MSFNGQTWEGCQFFHWTVHSKVKTVAAVSVSLCQDTMNPYNLYLCTYWAAGIFKKYIYILKEMCPPRIGMKKTPQFSLIFNIFNFLDIWRDSSSSYGKLSCIYIICNNLHLSGVSLESVLFIRHFYVPWDGNAISCRSGVHFLPHSVSASTSCCKAILSACLPRAQRKEPKCF